MFQGTNDSLEGVPAFGDVVSPPQLKAPEGSSSMVVAKSRKVSTKKSGAGLKMNLLSSGLKCKKNDSISADRNRHQASCTDCPTP